MARLPQPGADEGTWGDILNQYLQVSHKSDGNLKNNVVSGAAIQDATISEAKLDTALAAKVNSVAGDPTMGGDLSGTASNAQIAAGVVTATELASNAVTTAKITDANVTGTKLADSAVSTAKIADSNVTTAKIADGAITTAKLGTVGSPSNGQLLSYNGTTLNWTSPGAVPADLNDLSDVNTTGATDGQALVYQTGTWIPATVSSGGVTDHGALTGLSDDDHPQYHNDARGDARYYTQSQVDTSLAGKADTTDPRLSDTRTPTDNTVSTAKLVDGAVTEPKLAASNLPSTNDVLTWDGTDLTWAAGGSGDPAMGGDLSGTASNAQIVAGAVDTTELAAGAVTDAKVASGISQAKITNLTTDLAGKEPTITAGTTGEYWRGDKSWQTLDKTAVGLANVDNTSDATKNAASVTLTNKTISGASNTLSNIAQSSVTNLTTDLAGKEASITAGTTAQYWRGDKSWQTLDKTAVGLSNVDNTSDATKNSASATLTNKTISGASNTLTNIAQSSVTNLTTDLANKLDDKNETVSLTDSTNDKFVRVNITDDTSPTSGWPDRLAFYFSGIRTGYHNEYGELRARPAKNNTVALRAMGWNGASSAYVFEVTNNGQTQTYFGVSSSAIDVTLPISSNSNITTTGTVSGSNIGAKVTTSATAPSSPAVGDVWVDTST